MHCKGSREETELNNTTAATDTTDGHFRYVFFVMNNE
jgi:hypothetical protein